GFVGRSNGGRPQILRRLDSGNRAHSSRVEGALSDGVRDRAALADRMRQPQAEVDRHGPVPEPLPRATEWEATQRNVLARLGEGSENDLLPPLAGSYHCGEVHDRPESPGCAASLDEEQIRLRQSCRPARGRARRPGGVPAQRPDLSGVPMMPNRKDQKENFMSILTHNLGFARIGAKRELKKALENYWSGKGSESELFAASKAIRQHNWLLQKSAGMDLIPSNDFSLYDQVLDTCALVGAVPARFHWSGGKVDWSTYFAMARGLANEAFCPGCGQTHAATALEMTKWFDTNYHYLVPELGEGQTFELSSTKPFDEFAEALALGIRTMPVLVGPMTFLLLAKTRGQAGGTFNRLSFLPQLLPVYGE